MQCAGTWLQNVGSSCWKSITDFGISRIRKLGCTCATPTRSKVLTLEGTTYMGVLLKCWLNPIVPKMVLLIIIPFLNGYFIGKINPTFSGPNPFDSH